MWRQLEVEGVGYDLPLGEPHRFVQAIEREALVPEADAITKCQAYVSRMLRLNDLRAANRALFSS
jgi:hypothetical protein